MEPRRVLLVDDDLRVHELVRWSLRPPQFEIEAFTDPRQALGRVAEVRPHLIICDMMMPTMDGQVFLRLVKQSPELKRIPFLFLTAVRLGSEVQAALNAGAEAYLVKPFPLAKLVETVNTILAAAAARAQGVEDGSAASGGEGQEERQAWPELAQSDVLDMVTRVEPSEPPGRSRAASATGLPVASIPRVPMESVGETVLSGTALSVPEREDEAPTEDGDAAVEREEAAQGPAEPPPVFEGRFSTVELGGLRIQVVTEAETRPNFVITTVMSAGDKGLRKIESFWSHPLRRPEDVELVKRQIELQHDRAVADVRREPLFGPRRKRVWSKRKRAR